MKLTRWTVVLQVVLLAVTLEICMVQTLAQEQQDAFGCYQHHQDCNACISHGGESMPCGVCGDTGECLPGTPDGPTDVHLYSKFGRCPGRWQHRGGSMLIQKEEGQPVNPQHADIYLVPGDPLPLPVYVTRPFSDTIDVDLVVVQDSSMSMPPYMRAFAAAAPRLIAKALALSRHTWFGYNGYIEKHQAPGGDVSGTTTSWSFRMNMQDGISPDPAAFVIGADMAHQGLTGNYDVHEDMLTAIMYTIKCNSLMKLRPGSVRIFAMFTDAYFKQEADYETMSPPTCQRTSRYTLDAYDCVNHPGCQCGWRASMSNWDRYFCLKLKDAYIGKSGLYSMADATPLVNIWMNSTLTRDHPLEDNSNAPDWSLAGQQSFYITSSNHRNCPFRFAKSFEGVCDPDPMGTGIYRSQDQYLWGKDQDFPSLQVVHDAMLENNVSPIFAAYGGPQTPGYNLFHPGSRSYSKNYKHEYQQLVQNWGFGSYVGLTSDPDQGDAVVQHLLDAIEGVLGRVRLTVLEHENYVQSISPITGYHNVAELATVEFTVTFHVDPANPMTEDFVYNTLAAVGFGQSSIRIWSVIPCIGCDGEPGSGAHWNDCEECAEETTCPRGCDGVPYSDVQEDICGVCGGDGLSCFGCDGVKDSGADWDLCGVCGGDNACLDCAGIPDGGAVEDECGVCGGNGMTCITNGCDGEGGVLDICDVCNGDNTTCVDCFGIPHGAAMVDACGVCGGMEECRGCDGVLYPELPPEEVPQYDICGVCGGSGTSCLGCDGVPYSGLFEDDCGVCGGANECFGCDGKKYGPGETVPEIDRCGICGGLDLCVGCDDQLYFPPLAPPEVDECGVCGGNNLCLGCDGVPNSFTQFDECGVCGGNSTTCLDCMGVPNGEAVVDDCGVCDGDNECLVTISIPEAPSGGELQPAEIGAIIGGTVAAVVLVAAGAAAFFIYKRITGGADWFVPNALSQKSLDGAHDNPLFQGQNRQKDNPLYKPKDGDAADGDADGDGDGQNDDDQEGASDSSD